jgi:CRISPR-associated endonuclease Csn1
MNELTNTENFTSKNQQGHKIPAIPLELSKGFQKKRIDHRHHAMDALIIACATRDHINLLNNQSAKSDISRYDLQNKLRNKEKETYFDKKEDKQTTRDVFKGFKMPWNNFTVDARNELEKIVISFKQNLRVINKASNRYEKIKDGKKIDVKQEGINWAIRKPLHKETVYAKVDLPHIKVPKGKFITAGRTSLDTSFDLKKIETITDTGIQKILKNYLASKENKPELAFSPEGIEEMNNNISAYNEGKSHKPIIKVRTFEVGSRFALGTKGNKKDKYVEAAKGTNLFFAIYADENGSRSYETIPLNIVIERLKQGLKEVPEMNEKGHILLFHLSPNDLVYVPTEDDRENIRTIDWGNLDKEQLGRIYKMVSSSGNQCFFIRQDVATSIVNKAEFSPLNKMERRIDGVMIKEHCFKLNIDRLGNIKPAIN